MAARLTAEPGIRTPLGIRVGPAAALPRSSFLRIRGLPPMAALSDGHSIAPGSWAVPITALDDLSVTMAPDASGALRDRRHAGRRRRLGAGRGQEHAHGCRRRLARPRRAKEPDAKAPASATILRAGTEPPNEARGSIGGPGLRSSQSMTPEDRERAMRLMQKGEEHLAEGNVSAARLMFERAADAGLAQAAMALAATFDAAELARLSVRGIQPDCQGGASLVRARAAARCRGRGAATAPARLELNDRRT